MKINLPHIPERPEKPRKSGITMVMDKGLSLREAEDLISSSGHLIDFVKLGFGTSAVMNNVEPKIKLYQEANIKCYFGGTLFEAYLIRDKFEDYRKLIEKNKVLAVEISDGSMQMKHETKCKYIRLLSKSHTVLSEVGSKIADKIIPTEDWIKMMLTELESGSFKVIAEARESGNVGIYNSSGKAQDEMINQIIAKVPKDDILWEAPLKSQQAWFIKLLGANVNLGNIAPNEVIPMETLRVGLRGDTFFEFLPEEYKNKII